MQKKKIKKDKKKLIKEKHKIRQKRFRENKKISEKHNNDTMQSLIASIKEKDKIIEKLKNLNESQRILINKYETLLRMNKNGNNGNNNNNNNMNNNEKEDDIDDPY